MKPAILVVDMVKDNFLDNTRNPITPLARAIVPAINRLTGEGRKRGWPVVFACDSFLPGDFIFQGRMKPCALRGTEGSEVTELLERHPGDVVLPKRRFSAFFKTDLDQTLRLWRADTAIVCGIATHICVLSTALDALCLDFRAVIVEDATASYNEAMHRQTCELYRKNPLQPLFQVLTVDQVLAGEWESAERHS